MIWDWKRVSGDVGCMTTIVLSVLAGLLLLTLWGCPTYSVWQKGMSGKAQLAEAEYNRQIKVREALAKKDSAQFEADSEIIRAKGVAQANKIIGESLKGNESYLRYLWIQTLQDEHGERVYIPTEAALPILEARPRSNPEK